MTEQQEGRPFLALADDELEMIVTALLSEAARRNGAASFTSYSRLAELGWQELRRRRASARSLCEGKFPDPQRCSSFASILGQPFRPILCEGVEGHDGPHFATNRHGQREEWR